MNNNPVSPHTKKLSRLQRGSAIIGAGLLAGLIAAGIGGVASAQTTVSADAFRTAMQVDHDASESQLNAVPVGWLQVEGDSSDQDDLLAPEDDAVFERFEQCLQDAGLDPESDVEPDEAALDAAFEQCDPIFDDLNEDFGDVDVSPEDQAVFERYDQCLQDAGLDFQSEVEPDEAALDAAFEKCDPILEELTEDYFGEAFDGFDDADFGDISAEDQALFEQYEQCLDNSGVDFESEVEPDEAALDAAFEQCDPILDGLSDAFGAFPDLSDEDQAVYDRFEQCLTDGGVEDLFDADQSDESAIESLYETCEPILDELSEEAQALFDCPSEETHEIDGDV